MENCVFCNIVNKKLSSYIISQDKWVTAFLDINPVSKGHVLIVPNEHVEKLHELESTEIANALMHSITTTAKQLVKVGLCTDYSIVQSNGKYADQDINHLHFHIIPRYEKDDVIFKLDTDKIAALKENLILTSDQLAKK